MKKHLITISIILVISILVIFSLAGCSDNSVTINVGNKEIMVFAGSASKPALDEAAQAFEKQTGIKVYINYGGSGTMLSQMKLTKTGDVYIPGSPDYLIKAERDDVIDSSTTKIVAYLIPVISVQHGNPKNIQSLADLAKPGMKVGIGNPSTVCVGLYAIEILEKNGLIEDIYPNIITNAESCEKTATLLSLKSVDAVMGWDVFHYWDPDNIDIVYLHPEQTPRIAYIPVAVSNYTKDRASSEKFIDYLASTAGKSIFSKWGYVTDESSARKYAPNAVIGGEYNLPESYSTLVK